MTRRRRRYLEKWRGLSAISLLSSVSALLISIATALYNLIGYFERPTLVLLAPEQVTFYQSSPSDRPYVTMVTDFNIFNNSRPEKYGLVLGESLKFTIKGVPRVLRWQQIGKWLGDEFQATAPAQPFAIAGGAVIAQEVSFEPRSKRQEELRVGENEDDNWVEWNDFIEELRKGNLRVRCVVEGPNGKTVNSEVEVRITQGVIQALENPEPKKRWAAPACNKL